MIPVRITSHPTEAAARLTDAFRKKPVVSGLVRGLAKSAQRLENAIWSVVDAYRLSHGPANDALDRLGALVGEPRKGRGDVAYLLAVRLRIRVNKSQGRAEDIIDITRLSTKNGFSYEEFPEHVSSVITANTLPFDEGATLLGLLAEAKSLGTRLVLEWGTSGILDQFYFGSNASPPPNGSTFSDAYSGLPSYLFPSATEATL